MAIMLARAIITVSKDREQDVVNYLEGIDMPGRPDVTCEYSVTSNDEVTSTFEVSPYYPEEAELFEKLVQGILLL